MEAKVNAQLVSVVTFDQFSEVSRLSKNMPDFSSNSMAEIVYIFFGI
jgi:hypothetical protein